MSSPPAPLVYTAPPANGYRPRHLVLARPGCDLERFTFYDHIEIGRDDAARERVPGLLLIPEPTVSRRHCVITQTGEGRCLIRDLSRNGTRLLGRRMVPNVEYPIGIGQSFSVTAYEFMLTADERPAQTHPASGQATIGVQGTMVATVLVGDIRDYTVLVRRADSGELQRSVSRVFELLTAAVAEHGGTVKEFPGDAIMAFWEGSLVGDQAAAACRAVVALDQLVRRIAADPEIWAVRDFPLQMDWALATGTVAIDAFGGTQRAGLSLVGEPVVLAFRLEKFCTDQTGRIVVCPTTRVMAGNAFAFRDLGEMMAKGFDRPDRVYALQLHEGGGVAYERMC